MRVRVICALVCARRLGGGRDGCGARRRSGSLGRDRFFAGSVRVLPGRHLGPPRGPVVRRLLLRPLPHQLPTQPARPQLQRDPLRGLQGRRGYDRIRRHQLGPPGARPHPAAARVLLSRSSATSAGRERSAWPIRRRSRWRYYVKLDPAFINKAMWAEASAERQAAVDLERERRERPARVRHGRDLRRQRGARRHAAAARSGPRRRGAADRHHRCDLRQAPSAGGGRARNPVAGVVGAPLGGFARARDRKGPWSASPRGWTQ